jgi:hypothetical protein
VGEAGGGVLEGQGEEGEEDHARGDRSRRADLRSGRREAEWRGEVGAGESATAVGSKMREGRVEGLRE